MASTVFDLSSLSEEQRTITQQAIDAVSFDWDLLIPGLRASVGRERIPVEWADLSRWLDDDSESNHQHVHGEDDTGHVLVGEVDGRRAALGLAWYSGKISIDSSLVSRPDVAREVFVAEGAHMIDFFYMTNDQRRRIFAVYHAGNETAHGHDWFDDTEGVGDPSVRHDDYWSWVGESFMAGFLHAYSDLPTPLEARQPWVHETTPEIAQQIRLILTPTPPAEPGPVWIASSKGTIYHRPECYRTRRIKHRIELSVTDGYRPCKNCKPAS